MYHLLTYQHRYLTDQQYEPHILTFKIFLQIPLPLSANSSSRASLDIRLIKDNSCSSFRSGNLASKLTHFSTCIIYHTGSDLTYGVRIHCAAYSTSIAITCILEVELDGSRYMHVLKNIYMGQCLAKSPFWVVFQVFKFFDFP